MPKKAQQKMEFTPEASLNKSTFMAKLPPECRGFFKTVLDLAEQRKLVVYWGTQGFSLRVKCAGSTTLISFAFGWTSGHFYFCFEYLGYFCLPEGQLASFREELLKFGLFSECGKNILCAYVDDSIKEKATEMLLFILDRIDAFVEMTDEG
jgi:hypothetical protein